MIPYGCQSIDEQDISAVTAVLKSSFLTQGPLVPEFERQLAERVGSRAAVMTNSATSALHLACLVLGVGEGDVVWTSPMSFVASANCALYCSAKVDFVDIDESTGNLSIQALEQKLFTASLDGKLPKVLIPVHFAGSACDMADIAKLATKYGFKVIEDASHALGAMFRDSPVGSCEYSDITIFSFHPVKMITTGEGGCLCINDEEIESKLRELVTHGITKDRDHMRRNNAEPWWYEQHTLGFNYRMTDIQAALGISQLTKLDSWVKRRNSLVLEYKRKTQSLPIDWLDVHDDRLCSYHLAVIKVPPEDRLLLFNRLRSQKVLCQVHYIPIYRQPYYSHMGMHWPQAESFYNQVLSIPLYPGLTDDEQNHVVNTIEGYFK